MNNRAKRNSSQATIKLKMAVATSPPPARGKTIAVKVLNSDKADKPVYQVSAGEEGVEGNSKNNRGQDLYN